MREYDAPRSRASQSCDPLAALLENNKAPPFDLLLALERKMHVSNYGTNGQLLTSRARLHASFSDPPPDDAPLSKHVGWLLFHHRGVWSSKFMHLPFPEFVKRHVGATLENCVCNYTYRPAAQLLRIATGQPRFLPVLPMS